jgi:hypothetical protein
VADAKHVFISYCSTDRERGMALKAWLEAESHTVRIDQQGLRDGAARHQDIAEAILDAYAAVAIHRRLGEASPARFEPDPDLLQRAAAAIARATSDDTEGATP